MTADEWLEQYYAGEFFSGRFDFLKAFIEKKSLHHFEKVITIGGTNGKGETSRLLSKTLLKNNINHALWTSPHLKTVLERFHFPFVSQLEHQELIEVFEELQRKSQEDGVKFSYFEFLYIAFLMLAKKYNIQTLVLEVGLGGRLDAVNTLDADIAAITSISRDHQDLLGKRYDLILHEKLGVVRSDQVLLTNFENKYLRQYVKKYLEINHLKTKWIDLFEQNKCSKTDDFSTRNHTLSDAIASVYFTEKDFIKPDVAMSAARCIDNIDSVSFSLFPSHNPDGMRKLVQLLIQRNYTNIDLIVLSFSDRSDKDIETMLKALQKTFECPIVLFHFSHLKAASRDKLIRLGKKFNLDITDDKEFFETIDYSKQQHLLFTGSNYFLGHIMQKLELTSTI